MMCVKPVTIYVRNRKQIVPCSKCLACLSNKRNDWSFRLMQEWKASKGAFFVTLTYNQKYIPKNGSLSKRHVQLFLKRLRRKDEHSKIRYYAVGEYGGKSLRPHYHLLLFNCNDERMVRKSWTHPQTQEDLGIVHIGSVTGASIGYVTKYLIQPDLAVPHLEKPFSLMSRAYGIGGHYLTDEMVAWHRSGDKAYTAINGQKCRLPRFYRDKIWPQKFLEEYTEDGIKLPRIPLDEIYYTDRSRVVGKSQEYARKKHREELKWYWKTYGKDAPAKMKEMRDAALGRLKIKVAFTQTL